jgi:DNA-binding transcriptional MerR regulator
MTGKYIRKRELAIANLLCHDTLTEAAGASGISVRTLHSWLKEPAFQKEYRQAKAQLLFNTIKNLQTVSGTTIDNLHDVLINSKSDASRVAAARLILEYSFRGYETELVTQDIEELQEEVKRLAKNNRY